MEDAALVRLTLTCCCMMVGLASTRQQTPTHSLWSFIISFSMPLHSAFPSWYIFFPSLTPPPPRLSLFICLNPLIPKPLYICLLDSPSSSPTLLLSNHFHHSRVKSGGKQALVFDGQVLSADISPRSTLSPVRLGRVEWQPAFPGCTFRLWSSPELCVYILGYLHIPTRLRLGQSDKMAKYTKDYNCNLLQSVV